MRGHEAALIASSKLLSLGLCRGCGRCCMAGSALEVNDDERDYLTAAGSKLRHIPKDALPAAVKPKRGREVYIQETDCGNYDPDTGACKDYQNRPGICREFKAGSYLCNVMREDVGQQPAAVELGMPTIPVSAPREVA